jgi:hypothetical protein
VRFSGTKLGDEADTKEYDYAIHPIYSAAFEISPRRKRKITVEGQRVLDLISRPKQTIEAILKSQNRVGRGPLPSQLGLFDRFYDGTS